MEHPKDVGDHTTLAIMLALHESGYQVATPFGENTRYDLILDDGERMLRVQCKTGRMRLGAVEFATASSYAHHPNEKRTQRHYVGQVDHFAVYCRETGGVYLIPIDALPLDRAYLRVTAPPERPAQAHPLRQGLRNRTSRMCFAEPRATTAQALRLTRENSPPRRSCS